MLDINSVQTEKKLAEQLGVTQQAISIQWKDYVRWKRSRRKADGFRMNCPKTTKIDSVTLHTLCFQSFGKKIFCTKLLQAMKSEFFIIILNVENHGLTLVNLHHRRQSPISQNQEDFALYLVGLVCCITTEWNNHGRPLPTTID